MIHKHLKNAYKAIEGYSERLVFKRGIDFKTLIILRIPMKQS
jgi:hypothetical protein